jgi:hypothetical protein
MLQVLVQQQLLLLLLEVLLLLVVSVVSVAVMVHLLVPVLVLALAPAIRHTLRITLSVITPAQVLAPPPQHRLCRHFGPQVAAKRYLQAWTRWLLRGRRLSGLSMSCTARCVAAVSLCCRLRD